MAAVLRGYRHLRERGVAAVRSGDALQPRGLAFPVPGAAAAQQGAAEGRPAPPPLPLLSHPEIAFAVFLGLNSGTARMCLGLFYN